MSETEAAKALRSYLERIERLTEERKAIADDIGDIFKELESNGYDKHAAKIVLKIRAADDGMAQYTDRTATVDTYLAALGMLPDRAPAPAQRAHVEKITQFRPKSEPRPEIPGSLPVPAAEAKGGVNWTGTESATSGDSVERHAPIPQSSALAPPGAATTEPEAIPLPTSGSTPFKLRPKCLNPDRCGGYGTKHCYDCLKADASATLQHGALA